MKNGKDVKEITETQAPKFKMSMLANMTYDELVKVRDAAAAGAERAKRTLIPEAERVANEALASSGLTLAELIKLKRKPREVKQCTICEADTDKPHDARAHRSQMKKGKFSDAELAERGMKWV